MFVIAEMGAWNGVKKGVQKWRVPALWVWREVER